MIELPSFSFQVPELPDVFLGGAVELDVGDEQIAIEAGISINDDDNDALKRANHAANVEWYTPRNLRIPFGLNVSGAVGGSAFPITDLPHVGRKLEIKRIYLNLSQPVSQSLPNVEVYLIGQPSGFNTGGVNPTDPLNLSSANIIASWKQSLPIQQTWGRNEAVIYNPENLILALWVGSGTTAFTLSGNIQVIDSPRVSVSEPVV